MAAVKPARGSRRTKISRKAHIEQARRRLLGIWRSDKRRTLSQWLFKKGVSAKNRAIISGIFGKMTWRFTKKSLYARSGNRSCTFSYSLLWADEWSVVLRVVGVEWDKCYHLRFDNRHFYIPVTHNNSEYFRKLK